MTLFDLFKRRGSAPVARERLQVLLAYERQNRPGSPCSARSGCARRSWR